MSTNQNTDRSDWQRGRSRYEEHFTHQREPSPRRNEYRSRSTNPPTEPQVHRNRSRSPRPLPHRYRSPPRRTNYSPNSSDNSRDQRQGPDSSQRRTAPSRSSQAPNYPSSNRGKGSDSSYSIGRAQGGLISSRLPQAPGSQTSSPPQNESSLSSFARNPPIKYPSHPSSTKKAVTFADPLASNHESSNYPAPKAGNDRPEPTTPKKTHHTSNRDTEGLIGINEYGHNFLNNMDSQGFKFYNWKGNEKSDKDKLVLAAFEQPGLQRIWIYSGEWKFFRYDIQKLCKQSDTYKEAKLQNPNCPIYGKVDLNTDPERFGIFLDWVSKGTFETSEHMIKIPQDIKNIKPRGEAWESIRIRYYQLVDMYVIGEILRATKFKNEVMDALCKTGKMYAEVRGSLPGYDIECVRDTIFNEIKIPKESPLRRVTLDMLLHGLNINKWPSDFFDAAGPGHAFVSEFCRHATKTAREKDPSQALCAPWFRPKCFYHEHPEGYNCTS